MLSHLTRKLNDGLIKKQRLRQFSKAAGGDVLPALSELTSKTWGLWIDGKEVPALNGRELEVKNPATGEHLCNVAEGDGADVNLAIDNASEAFEDGRWSGLEPRERGRILNKAAEIMRERLPTLAVWETVQTGRVLREYRAQLGRVPDWFEYHGALAQTIEGGLPPFSDPDHLCYVRRVPLGVCGLITPWNHPVLIASKKISVALAAGNTVVVKPPGPAPCSIIELARIMKEAGLPDGVMNVVPSVDIPAGEAMTSHEEMVKIDLTGGTATGYKVGELAGRRALHYTAELGGNAPVLVFDDCKSVDVAVNGVAFAAFVASGQTCVSAKRILVQESIFDEFVSKLADKASGLRMLDPLNMESHLGPLIHDRSVNFVESQVNEAIEQGAVVRAGGKRPGPDRCDLHDKGFWFEPTVLEISGPENPAFRDEIFGPVVTVQSFKTEEDAIELANDSQYGLGGAVWTENVARAHRVGRKVRAGVFWVNAHHRNDPSAPWGGFKESGIGRENGWEAFREYTETQTVVVRTTDAVEDWFGVQDSRYS